ncbi:alpha/beta fold hydrolase [Evansella tamaricis]|uniref:Alpha/beta hydrolase n=1 Tax=Evansella tamaricis TaxID=2069301 RepID=A0ABS6JA83_9BACI|nr:alpha/beta hydrolase [Evansella tamaricis]MBU9710456.1 alpha/beta hydrolase [Evansella tamaricis]
MPFFEMNNGKLFYEIKGTGKKEIAVVFLNGVMTTTASWALYYPLFEKLGYSVLLHDFKGQMKSDKPKGPYTFKDHASDLKQLLDYLEIKKIHIISTSYGSQVGLRFAMDYPDETGSLTIIGGASEIDDNARLFVEGWKKFAEKGSGEEFFWGVVPSIYHNDFVSANRGFLDERAQLLNEIHPDYFKGQINLYDTFINDTTMTGELEKIGCPSLVLVGEEDKLMPRKFSEILVKKIPQAEFAIIPNAAHVTIFEQPEVVKSIITGFVVKNT